MKQRFIQVSSSDEAFSLGGRWDSRRKYLTRPRPNIPIRALSNYNDHDGLYLESINRVCRRKWLLRFLAVWTKVAIVLVPIYIGSVLKFLVFDEAPFTLKMAVFRRVLAFSCFLFKNVFFYLFRRKIEALIDLWDSFFREDLYPETREEKFRTNQKQNIKTLTLSWMLTLTAGLIYTVPPFFSKTKQLSHPSGIPYRHQSPDFEAMLVFDFFRVVVGCLSAVSLDCILMVFLSLVLVQLTHLRDCLVAMLNEISVDARGHVVFASAGKRLERGTGDGEAFSEGSGKRKRGGRFPPGGDVEGSLYEEAVKGFEKKIRIWIRHHQEVIRFFEELKSIFTPIASLQLIYVVFYTCFTAFHLIRAKFGIDVIVIPFVAASNLISLFIWCYMGVHIELTSSGLFGNAFGGSWHVFPGKIQKAFCFIIARGSKPLSLKGISLFGINLVTFFQVFKITYQLFAFLLQVAHEE